MFETAKDAYARFVDARGEARKVAREEFEEAINRRIEELVKWESDDLIESLQALESSGMDAAQIRFGVFGTNPSAAQEWLTRANITPGKRGRKPNPDGSTHGTNSTYVRGCRCDECREASNAYQRDYQRRKKTR